MMFVADELGFDDFAYFAWDARVMVTAPVNAAIVLVSALRFQMWMILSDTSKANTVST